MVLQRSRPIEVWGFDASYGETLDVKLNHASGGEVSSTEAVAGSSGTWRATLSTPPASATGKELKLMLNRRGSATPAQVLEDIVLGDIYLFSGQSNVDLPVSYVHQFDAPAQEAEERFADKMGHTGQLRLMIVPARCGLTYHDSLLADEFPHVKECKDCPPPFGTTPKAAEQINSCNLLGGHRGDFTYCNCDSLRWTRPTGTNVRGFSAVAWFTGKALLSSHHTEGVPIGLIRSSWGATNIAVWSGIDALAKCPQEGEPPTSFAPYVKSALWGHMIYPLKGLQLSAAIWVHGARNIGGHNSYMGGSYYSCALRAMITDWREKLGQETLPFLVVESPVYCNELDYRTWHTWCDDRKSQLRFPDEHLPEMRFAQNTAEKLPNVYLVSIMDQGSLKKAMGGAIHSERKPELGKRVALAAQAAVYRDEKVVWSGPTATFAWQSGAQEVTVCFDTRRGGNLFLNESVACPPVVLPVYCSGATFELQSPSGWSAPASVSVHQGSVVLRIPEEVTLVDRVRYAWADWPVCSLLSEAGMPARLFNLEVHKPKIGAEPSCPEDGSGISATIPVADPRRSRVRGSKGKADDPTDQQPEADPATHQRPEALRVISILASLLVCSPLFAVAAVAARWSLSENGSKLYQDLQDSCNGEQRSIGAAPSQAETNTTEQSSEVGDFQALDMPPAAPSSSAETTDCKASVDLKGCGERTRRGRGCGTNLRRGFHERAPKGTLGSSSERLI